MITRPAPLVVEATGPGTAVVPSPPAVSDLADPAPGTAHNVTGPLSLGTHTVLWTSTDGSGNSATATQSVTVRDTTAPVITRPAPLVVDGTGSLVTVVLSPPAVSDLVDPAPRTTHNFTSPAAPGTYDVLWTATDFTGNGATAIQRVTVRDTTGRDITPPVITAPAHINVTAKGLLTWVDLRANVSDAADPSPVLVHNASEYLPLGNTTVTWNATDASGNSATATSVVTVTDDGSLDTSWYYRVGYGSHLALSASKHALYPDAIEMKTSNRWSGQLHLFKSFPKDELAANGNVTVELRLDHRPPVGVHLRDGGYSNTPPTGFDSYGPVSKGNGTLASATPLHDPDEPIPHLVTVHLSPDLSDSQEDDVTVFIDVTKTRLKKSILVFSVQLENHSRWSFYDYTTSQNLRGGHGEFVLTQPPAGASVRHPLPVHDTFDGTRDGWTYWGDLTPYTLNLDDREAGRKSIHMAADGFSTEAGISKTVDISGFNETGQRLVVSTDYRTSGTGGSPHVRMVLFDADSGDYLLHRSLAHGETRDTGWKTYTRDVTNFVTGSDAIKVVFYLYDGGFGQANFRVWYDDMRIYALDQTEPVPTTNTRAGSPAGAAAGSTDGPADDDHTPNNVPPDLIWGYEDGE